MARYQVEDDKPWYKQFWPWFIISLPATAVIASMITIKLAVDSADGLVSDEYYKEGLAINKDISKERFAKTMGLSAGLSLDKETSELRVNLSGKLTTPPATLNLELSHPTIKGLDQHLQLLSISKGVYVTRLPEVALANWIVSLSPENREWRLTGRVRFPETSSANLTP
jgi:hypothetical protein